MGGGNRLRKALRHSVVQGFYQKILLAESKTFFRGRARTFLMKYYTDKHFLSSGIMFQDPVRALLISC